MKINKSLILVKKIKYKNRLRRSGEPNNWCNN